MDDQDRIPDQDVTDGNDDVPTGHSTEGEGVPVPARIREAVEDVKKRVKEEADHGRDIVREYEERYGHVGARRRLEAPLEEDMAPPSTLRRSFKSKRRFSPGDVAINERKWAALAHGSTLLTALVGVFTLGMGSLFTVFVPFFIYLAFRKRSEYVAFHALQAFTIQLVGTVGWMTLLAVGFMVWVVLLLISVVLILVLVGIPLIILLVLLAPVFVLVSLALPLGMVVYSVRATFETWKGRDYRYPYIARWVESQMYNGLLSQV